MVTLKFDLVRENLGFAIAAGRLRLPACSHGVARLLCGGRHLDRWTERLRSMPPKSRLSVTLTLTAVSHRRSRYLRVYSYPRMATVVHHHSGCGVDALHIGRERFVKMWRAAGGGRVPAGVTLYAIKVETLWN